MMIRYIVVSENEIVKAEMERPNKFAYSPHGYSHALNVFEKHCLPLPRIPIEGQHKWKLWDEVVEGKDFRFGQTDCKLGREGCICFPYLEKWCSDAIYIAIPIQPTPEGEKVGFSRVEMKKVQDDINSVNAGAVIDKAKLLGFPCDINELCDVLQNTCQLLNGIKPDAVEEKWWSDWDESVLESLVKMLQQVQPFYKKQPTPQR